MRRMIKRVIGIPLLITAFLMTMWIPASAEETDTLAFSVELNPASVSTVSTGETVTMTLKANQSVSISGFDFTMDYNADILKLEKVEGNGSTINISASDVHIEKGLVSWEEPNLQDITISEKENIAVITFSVKEGVQSGVYPVGIKEIGLYYHFSLDTIIEDATAYTDLTIEEPVAAEPSFKTHSLILSGQIGMNFNMDLPAIEGVDYTDSYMEFTVNGKTQTVKYDPENMNQDGTLHQFTCSINSIQMGEDVKAVFHYGDGKTVEDSYSVEKYVESFWKNRSENDNANTQNLVLALADYGHYIQPFLAKARNWEVGKAYAEMSPVDQEGNSLITALSDDDIEAAKTAVQNYDVVRDPGESGIEKVSMSLYLDSNTSLYFYLKPKADFSGEVTAKLEDGTKLSAELQKDGRYRVTVPDISAHLLGTTYKVDVSADGNFTMEASAMSYVKMLMNSEAYKDDKDALKAMTALYRYYAAADAILNS